MANLNLPFVLLQPATCQFEPTLAQTKIYPFSSYNVVKASSGGADLNMFNPKSSMIMGSFNNHQSVKNSIVMGGANLVGSNPHQAFQDVQTHKSQLKLTNEESSQKFEFGKYSTFEDTPRSLIVTGDKESGTIVLWSQDVHLSQKIGDQGKLRTNKNLVSLVPRVALVPSITNNTGPLLVNCIIRSPAPNILSTSTHLLLSIHQDGILRLWTTDDGRCILASSPSLIPIASSYQVKSLTRSSDCSPLSGVVAILPSEAKDIYFVHAYKMTLLKKLAHNFEGIVSLKVSDSRLILGNEKKGIIQVWKRESSESSPSSQQQQKQDGSQPQYLELQNTDENSLIQQLAFKLEFEADGLYNGSILKNKILKNGKLLVVTEHGIKVFKAGFQRMNLFDFNTKVAFSQVLHQVKSTDPPRVITLDQNLNFSIFEIINIDIDQPTCTEVIRVNLINDAALFEPFSVKTEGSMVGPFAEAKEEKDLKLLKIKEAILAGLEKRTKGQNIVRFEKEQNTLYSVINVEQKRGASKESCIVAWNITSIVENLKYKVHSVVTDEKLPLTVTPFRLFQSTASNSDHISLINFQPLLIKSFYNKHQFQFFFQDEHITESVIYTSASNPSYLFGTSYGRIFMVSMFQESDEKAKPILVIDSHHTSPITKLFIAYNPSRKPYLANAAKGMHLRGSNVRSSNSSSSNGGAQALMENGGHLISVSEDGTIAVTNLNSGEIHRAIVNHHAKGSELKGGDRHDSGRADFYFEQKNKQTLKRRNSFSNDFSVRNYYHLVRVKPQRIFNNAAFGDVDKILEVKSLATLRDTLLPRDTLTNLGSGVRQSESSLKVSKQSSQTEGGESPNNIFKGNSQRPPVEEFSSYACVSSNGGTIHILQITNVAVESLQLQGFDTKGEILGIYQDLKMHQIYVLQQNIVQSIVPNPVTKQMKKQEVASNLTISKEETKISRKLQFYVVNSKSNLLLRKLDQRYAMDVLLIKEAVDLLLSRNENFKQRISSQNSMFDFEGFQQFFKNKLDEEAVGGQQPGRRGQMGVGSHSLLDYLSLSANLPLNFHPHSSFTQNEYTYTLRDLYGIRKHLAIVGGLIAGQQKLSQEETEESQREVIWALNEAYYTGNRLYKSDFGQDYFEKQSGSTCLQSSPGSFFRSKQDIVVANGKQMIKLIQSQMLRSRQKQPTLRPQGFQSQRSLSPVGQRVIVHGEEDAEFEMHEEEKTRGGHQIPQPSSIKPPLQQQQSQPKGLEALSENKWPTRLLSVIHPFNVETLLDDALERYLGLNLPFLDFRVGLQGAEDSFSFVLTREDEDYHAERANTNKLIRMMRLSHYKKELMEELNRTKKQAGNVQAAAKPNFMTQSHSGQATGIKSMLQIDMQVDQLLESEPSVRFFGSEYWKISGYLSTVMPSMFLSLLTAVVDFAKEDVTYMLQEWLFIVQRINQQRTLSEANRVSLSAVSKLLLKKEPCISATARDVLLKPVLFALAGNVERLKSVIDEWSALVLDTYKRLKRETAVRGTQAAAAGGAPGNQVADKRLVNQYFGELEIRSLICISYYALYNHDHLDASLQYRVSKLTTILTREIVDKFNTDRRYIYLLTHLLQLLSTWMKMPGQHAQSQFSGREMIREVVKLLLFIYNMNKAPLSAPQSAREAVITRVAGENFYLIKPTQPELFLKLTAAKALLEVGENHTHEFLALIQEQATHLDEGPEYQQNVLEILKIFINSSVSPNTAEQGQTSGTGVNLEHHLIQITQILLKCFDPNELALRKNSHKVVSIILSIMVKMFPMVAFHHESQRLAVGTHDGPIAVYDMRTSAKWKILEGHQGNITCLQFDQKGNLLASYSATDRTVQLWKVGNTGFFSTIMGGTSKSSNKIALKPLTVRNPHSRRAESSSLHQEMSRNESLFENSNTVQPLQPTAQQAQSAQSSSSKRVNQCYVKFLQPKEKDVELKREDGSVSVIKLVK